MHKKYLYYLGKPATTSSISPNVKETHTLDASKLVDGIYVPEESDKFQSMCHTHWDDHAPWWRVDLQRVHCIWAVNILNRRFVGNYYYVVSAVYLLPI